MSTSHPVDPWQLQASLMHISDQPVPPTLQMTPEAVLYMALKMEEFQETLDAFVMTLDRGLAYGPVASCEPLQELIRAYANIALYIHGTGLAAQLRSTSLAIRRHLGGLSEAAKRMSLPIEHGKARELADGLTDEMVVTAGFALAAGIPGAACYEQVGYSNLSKADPTTGKIHKDPSGKWIKGPLYRQPEIDETLAPLVSENVRYYKD